MPTAHNKNSKAMECAFYGTTTNANGTACAFNGAHYECQRHDVCVLRVPLRPPPESVMDSLVESTPGINKRNRFEVSVLGEKGEV